MYFKREKEDNETIDIHSALLINMHAAERPLITEILENHASMSDATQR
jgi:hypothetical protein